MGTTTIQSIVLIAVFGASVANADSFRPSYEDERVPPKKVSSDQAAVGNNIKNTQEKMRRAYEGQRAFQTVSGENIGTSIGNLKPGEEPLGGVYEDCDMKCIYEREIELLSLQALFSRYKVESVSTAISGLEDLSDPSDSNQKQLDYLAQELSPQYCSGASSARACFETYSRQMYLYILDLKREIQVRKEVVENLRSGGKRIPAGSSLQDRMDAAQNDPGYVIARSDEFRALEEGSKKQVTDIPSLKTMGEAVDQRRIGGTPTAQSSSVATYDRLVHEMENERDARGQPVPESYMVFDEVELANGEVLYSPKRGNCNAKKGEGLSDGGYCFNKVRYQLALKTFRESREGDLEFLRNNTEYKKALAEEDKNSGKRKFDERVSSTDRRAYRYARGAFLKTTTKRLKEDSNPSGITIQRDGNPQAFKEILRPSANKKKKNQREYDEAAAQADERAYQRYRQNASSGMAVYPKDEDLGKWGEAVRKTFTPAPQPQSDPAIP